MKSQYENLQRKIDKLKDRDLVKVVYVKPHTKLHQIIGLYNSPDYRTNNHYIEVLPRYTYDKNSREVSGTGSSGRSSSMISVSDILDIEKIKSKEQMIDEFNRLERML